MARRDPLLPNAGIVARREYRDRTRSPLFIVSTIVLALPGDGRRARADRDPLSRPPDRDADRGRLRPTPTWPPRAVGHRRRAAQHPAGRAPIRRPGRSRSGRRRRRRRGRRSRSSSVGRARRGHDRSSALPSGQIDVALPDRRTARTAPAASSSASRRSGSASSTGAPGCQPDDRSATPFQPPTYHDRLDQHRDRRRRRRSTRSRSASRDFLGIVFVVLLFITDRHLRHVGRDRRRRREEQPGHGADDQRRLAAPDADRQGRRDRRGRVDPVRRDRRAGARPARLPGPDRDGGPRPGLGGRRAAGRPDPGAAGWVTASSSCSGSRCSP